jgi:hypothetical protein
MAVTSTARKSGSQSKAKSGLDESFKDYIESADPNELADFSSALGQALDTLTATLTTASKRSTATATAAASASLLSSSPPRTFLVATSDGSSNGNTASDSNNNSYDDFYAPKSTSRRNSRAGSELASSMKLNAAAVLEALGDVSDEDDDDLGLGECTLGDVKEDDDDDVEN